MFKGKTAEEKKKQTFQRSTVDEKETCWSEKERRDFELCVRKNMKEEREVTG